MSKTSSVSRNPSWRVEPLSEPNLPAPSNPQGHTQTAGAPLPYDTLETGKPSNNGALHIYITDADGRKIAAIWGKSEEKQFTAFNIINAVNSHHSNIATIERLTKALEDVRHELFVGFCLEIGRTQPDPHQMDRFTSRPHIRIIDTALSYSSNKRESE